MKKKIEKFTLIQRLLKNQVDLAATRYCVVVKNLQEELQKQQQLLAYQQTYNENMFAANDSALDMSMIKQKTTFLAHIGQVIKNQQYSIEKLEQEQEKRKEIWLQNRNKYERLSEYIERLEAQWQDKLDIREQKELDSLVNDLFAYNASVSQDINSSN